MKIVFWSCVPGQSSVTSSMIAIACMAALNQGTKCSLLQTHYHDNGLQNAFIPQDDLNTAQQLDDFGIDAFIRDVKGDNSNVDSVEDCSFTYFGGKLNLYTETRSSSEAMYKKELEEYMPLMLSRLDANSEITFIDCEAGNHQLSLQVLSSADLVVACFPQSYRVLDMFFANYNVSEINMVYLFGDYDPKQSCNLKSLYTRYKKVITAKNSAYVLHSSEFADHLNAASITKYFKRNINCKKNDSNYEFIKSVQGAMITIMQNAGIKVRDGGFAE